MVVTNGVVTIYLKYGRHWRKDTLTIHFVTFPNLREGVLCFNSQIVLLENRKVSKVSGIPAFFRVKSQVIKLCLLPMVQSLCVFPELWSPVAMCVGFRHPLLGLSKLRLVLFTP